MCVLCLLLYLWWVNELCVLWSVCVSVSVCWMLLLRRCTGCLCGLKRLRHLLHHLHLVHHGLHRLHHHGLLHHYCLLVLQVLLL